MPNHGRATPVLYLDLDGTVRVGGPGNPFVNGPEDLDATDWRATA